MSAPTTGGQIYFALYGDDLDPDEITRLVGCAPTSSRRKGDPIPKHTWWKISGENVTGDLVDVYEMSSTLVDKLVPYEAGIISAMREKRLEAILEVVLQLSTDDSVSTPALGFSPKVIAFLHAVGASVDIDTYLNAP